MNLVMIDYDGVIVDSLAVCYRCFAAACRETGLMDLGTREDFIALFDQNLYQSMADRGLDNSAIDRILQVYEQKQEPLLDTVAIFPGMEQALAGIARDNRLVIITSNLSAHTREILDRHGVTCCSDIIGADQEKSKIRKINRAQLRYPELPAYYLGDTRGDMIEGHLAGVNTVGVLWGWHSRARLLDGGAQALLESPADMVAFFQAVSGNCQGKMNNQT